MAPPSFESETSLGQLADFVNGALDADEVTIISNTSISIHG
jgi:hypothetical protein